VTLACGPLGRHVQGRFPEVTEDQKAFSRFGIGAPDLAVRVSSTHKTLDHIEASTSSRTIIYSKGRSSSSFGPSDKPGPPRTNRRRVAQGAVRASISVVLAVSFPACHWRCKEQKDQSLNASFASTHQDVRLQSCRQWSYVAVQTSGWCANIITTSPT